MSGNLIDIHNHSLYGIDDGAKSLEEMLEMIKVSEGEGVSHIVFTPHCREYLYPNDFKTISYKFESIRGSLDNFKKMNFFIGAEIFFCSDIAQKICNHLVPTINNSRYFLFELPDFFNLRVLLNIIFEINLKGYLPVISHIERNPSVFNNFEHILKLVNSGVLIQITALSILGGFGRDIERFAFKLIEGNLAHVVASDAHNLRTRTPELRKAYKIVLKRYGEKLAKEIFVDNPHNLILNRHIKAGAKFVEKKSLRQKILDKIL